VYNYWDWERRAAPPGGRARCRVRVAGFLTLCSLTPATEAIVESALYKCVLKPLQGAINASLLEIHSTDGSLQQLKGNQLVVLATTTTDLGVTTSVPETPIMEKILQKLTSMHKAYSPEKKISTLLKTCKLIYDSMALGSPGRRGHRALSLGPRFSWGQEEGACHCPGGRWEAPGLCLSGRGSV
jgi:hypothetical protein